MLLARGQQAYSLAIAFAEVAEVEGSQVQLQLFATDLNDGGIAKARAGVYPRDIAQDVSPERLRRFFVEVDGSYRINKTDPRRVRLLPGTTCSPIRPSLASTWSAAATCSIYLEPVLQQQIMPTLHYALKPGGFLLARGIRDDQLPHRNLFEVEDAKHKIYVKKHGAGARRPSPILTCHRRGVPGCTPPPVDAHGPAGALAAVIAEADRILLELRPARRARVAPSWRSCSSAAIPGRTWPRSRASAQPQPASRCSARGCSCRLRAGCRRRAGKDRRAGA